MAEYLCRGHQRLWWSFPHHGRPGNRVRPGPAAGLRLPTTSLRGPTAANHIANAKVTHPPKQQHQRESTFQSTSVETFQIPTITSICLLFWHSDYLFIELPFVNSQCWVFGVSVVHLFCNPFISANIFTLLIFLGSILPHPSSFQN